MRVPFQNLTLSLRPMAGEINAAMQTTIESGWYILGKQVSRFEQEYASFTGAGYCVGVSNGLDALHLCLLALEIGDGDEVIVPSNTYIATLLAVSQAHARPVLVEPELDTYNIDPLKIEEKITPRTRAIMPVHLYGRSCDMDAIVALARKHRLYIIEDNAQAHGARHHGRMTGSFGDVNATSFYPTKNLGALGDAGAVTTPSEELANRIRLLRNYGSEKKYINTVIGYNNRMDELQAAMLLVRLRHLEQDNTERNSIAASYFDQLKNVPAIILPADSAEGANVFHLFVIRTEKRDALQKYLLEKNIETIVHYPVPPHLQKAYAHLGYKKGDFPISEKIAGTCLSLPLYPGLGEEAIAYICESIHQFFDA